MAEYRSIEPLAVKEVKIVAATTTAQDVAIGGRPFIIQNAHDTNIVYFKEKKGVAATSTNATILKSGTFPFQLVADTLSVVASAATNVVITFVE